MRVQSPRSAATAAGGSVFPPAGLAPHPFRRKTCLAGFRPPHIPGFSSPWPNNFGKTVGPGCTVRRTRWPDCAPHAYIRHVHLQAGCTHAQTHTHTSQARYFHCTYRGEGSQSRVGTVCLVCAVVTTGRRAVIVQRQHTRTHIRTQQGKKCSDPVPPAACRGPGPREQHFLCNRCVFGVARVVVAPLSRATGLSPTAAHSDSIRLVNKYYFCFCYVISSNVLFS